MLESINDFFPWKNKLTTQPTMSQPDYPSRYKLSKMKKSELQDLLAEKASENLQGKKADLIDRLLDIYSDEKYLIDQVQQDLKDDGEFVNDDEDDEYQPPPPPEDDDDEEWEEAEVLELSAPVDALCSCDRLKMAFSAFILIVLASAAHFQCTTDSCKAPQSINDIDWLKYRIEGSNFKGFEDMGFNEWKDMLKLKDILVIVVGLIAIVYALKCILVHYVATTAEEKRVGRSWEVLWLLISGVIHLWFEGTFVFFRHHEFYLKMDIYMVADWRYGNPMEPGTRAMEAITSVMEGPLCLLVAYAAVKNKIWRHPAQLIVTTCQIYGLIWFSLHPMFDSSIQHLSTNPFLFFAVAFGLNGPWGIFPPMLWVQSWRKIMESLEETEDPFAHIKDD